MSQADDVVLWEQRLGIHFAHLFPARRTWLAMVSFGIVLAQSALLNTVILQLSVALGQSYNTLRQRL